MELEPISATRMIALMLAGGLFACVGLYLMIRPRPQGAAKIEVFGLKFESSSAGLLVFIVGAAFLAVTLVVPEKDSETSVVPETRKPVDDQAAQDSTAGSSDTAVKPENGGKSNTALLLPADPGATEVEPNDKVQDANGMEIGATVEGRLKPGDVDRYVIGTEGHEGDLLIVTLRKVGGEDIYGETYNSDERRTGQLSPSGFGADVERVRIDGLKVYVMVSLWQHGDSPATYELTSRIEAE
ncbi:hypothetical protein R5H30_05950 [Sulfitobacter sp. D35]|uniref:hypothetical protein n=1 Tax=Sulfitobacter sp. D35 TaxID=3083252 RepID=UPI00296FA652|nr:hypothetical protein [Sulfitobacter sp. D35]MDW4497517.1 hypothetical protein [Sulfitobacter sp. D35]